MTYRQWRGNGGEWRRRGWIERGVSLREKWRDGRRVADRECNRERWMEEQCGMWRELQQTSSCAPDWLYDDGWDVKERKTDAKWERERERERERKREGEKERSACDRGSCRRRSLALRSRTRDCHQDDDAHEDKFMLKRYWPNVYKQCTCAIICA